MDTTTIAQSEPRKLTFDESRQLLVIQQTPESERTDEVIPVPLSEREQEIIERLNNNSK